MKGIIAATVAALMGVGLMASPAQALAPGDKGWAGELKVSADPIRGQAGGDVEFTVTWKFPDPKHRVQHVLICDGVDCYDEIDREYWRRTKYGWRVTFPAYITGLNCNNNVEFNLYAMRKFKGRWDWSSFATASIPVVCEVTL